MGLTVFKRRKIPDVFWYHDEFRFSLAYQKKKASLIFNIAGTDSNYKAGKMRTNLLNQVMKRMTTILNLPKKPKQRIFILEERV
jgi:hypothetical protein